ncbi:hypothetical protein QUW55_14040 [Phocaeicola barnesiae]|uniref:hypothetical protein n=1 Tax=Phocaeicola barnesiae TaxID=376804 RepID=UPI0025A33987|nr:hypothetical protein [Phocaeicola barnesiae]MDM8252709.1 hypothetical protein [Phocaeicola barnesiae]
MNLIEQLNIVEIRGTIFISQIQFSWELVHQIQDVLGITYIPSVNISSAPMFIEGKLMNSVMSQGEWSLTSPDKKQRIIFQSQKIDIIEEFNISYSSELISQFSKKCKSLFSLIISDSVKCSRIAIAPTFEYTGNKESIIAFANACFNLNKFRDVKMDNCEFSQVFRVKEKISDMDVFFNYLSKFYSINKVISIDGVNQLAEVTMIDFDINSKVNPDIVFDYKAIDDFFDKASTYCGSFLSLYFHE